MGKKTKKRPRWRKLSLDDTDERRSPSPAALELADAPAGTGRPLTSRHGFTRSHSVTTYVFDEDEYTKIQTPRQDMIFKKSALARRRAAVEEVVTSDQRPTPEPSEVSSDEKPSSECGEERDPLAALASQIQYAFIDPQGNVFFNVMDDSGIIHLPPVAGYYMAPSYPGGPVVATPVPWQAVPIAPLNSPEYQALMQRQRQQQQQQQQQQQEQHQQLPQQQQQQQEQPNQEQQKQELGELAEQQQQEQLQQHQQSSQNQKQEHHLEQQFQEVADDESSSRPRTPTFCGRQESSGHEPDGMEMDHRCSVGEEDKVRRVKKKKKRQKSDSVDSGVTDESSDGSRDPAPPCSDRGSSGVLSDESLPESPRRRPSDTQPSPTAASQPAADTQPKNDPAAVSELEAAVSDLKVAVLSQMQRRADSETTKRLRADVVPACGGQPIAGSVADRQQKEFEGGDDTQNGWMSHQELQDDEERCFQPEEDLVKERVHSLTGRKETSSGASDQDMSPESLTSHQDVLPETLRSDQDLPPELLTCDQDVPPESVARGHEVLPMSLTSDQDVPLELFTCNQDVPPGSVSCDQDVVPESLHLTSDQDVGPKSPTCDQDVSSESLARDRALLPESPSPHHEVSPESLKCDQESPTCYQNGSPMSHTSDQGMDSESPTSGQDVSPASLPDEWSEEDGPGFGDELVTRLLFTDLRRTVILEETESEPDKESSAASSSLRHQSPDLEACGDLRQKSPDSEPSGSLRHQSPDSDASGDLRHQSPDSETSGHHRHQSPDDSPPGHPATVRQNVVPSAAAAESTSNPHSTAKESGEMLSVASVTCGVAGGGPASGDCEAGGSLAPVEREAGGGPEDCDAEASGAISCAVRSWLSTQPAERVFLGAGDPEWCAPPPADGERSAPGAGPASTSSEDDDEGYQGSPLARARPLKAAALGHVPPESALPWGVCCSLQ